MTAMKQPRFLEPSSPHKFLQGKVALISGASRGIGKSTAELFAQEGAQVILCSRNAQELSSVGLTIEAGGGLVLTSPTDIRLPLDVTKLVNRAMAQYGKIDVLINNAGILGPRVPLTEYPLSDWDQVLRTNLDGTFYLTREVARHMTAQGNGCIITLSSSVGRIGREGWGAYAVSKFALEGLTQVLADDLRAYNMCIMTYNPGGTRTEMRADAYPNENPDTLPNPMEAAKALLYLTTQASPAISGKAFDRSSLPNLQS